MKFLKRAGMMPAALSLLLAFLLAAGGCGRTAQSGDCGSLPAEETTEYIAETGDADATGTEPFTGPESSAETERGAEPVTDVAETGTFPDDGPGEQTASVSPVITSIHTTPESPKLSFTVLRAEGSEDDLFGDENLPLTESSGSGRAYAALESGGFEPKERMVLDVVPLMRVAASSGSYDFDLAIFPAAGNSMQLMLEGLLQNLSSPGIDVDLSSSFVNRRLTSCLTYKGRTYTAFLSSQTSDLGATWLLEADAGASSTQRLVDEALSGNLCLDRFFELTTESGYSVDGAGYSRLALYGALGGSVLSKTGDGGLAASVLTAASLGAYEKAGLVLAGSDSESSSRVRVTSAGRASEGSVRMPLPSSTRGAAYVCPVNPSAISVAAAPYGIHNGSRLSAALTLLGESLGGFREEEELRYFGNSAIDGAGLCALISGAQSLDAGGVVSWGDLSKTVDAALASGTSASAFAANSALSRALNAFEAAEKILFDKLR